MFEKYPEVVRPAQAQAMLGIGRTKFYELLHSGAIPHRKIGGNYYIRKADLIEFITHSSEG